MVRPLRDRILARGAGDRNRTKGGLSFDSTKVVRVALQNAASVASLELTTEAPIAEWLKHGTTTSDKENS